MHHGRLAHVHTGSHSACWTLTFNLILGFYCTAQTFTYTNSTVSNWHFQEAENHRKNKANINKINNVKVNNICSFKQKKCFRHWSQWFVWSKDFSKYKMKKEKEKKLNKNNKWKCILGVSYFFSKASWWLLTLQAFYLQSFYMAASRHRGRLNFLTPPHSERNVSHSQPGLV